MPSFRYPSSRDKGTAFVLALVLNFLFFSITDTAFAASTLSGKVVDRKTGEPLPGANVVVRGTLLGAATGVDGSFTIANLQPGVYTLTATFVGYRSLSQEVTVGDDQEATVSFAMREDVLSLEEVVVTGIAARTSKEVAEVAVSRVAASTFTETNSYQTVSQLVNGKVAGVTLSTSSGNAGAGVRFNVRSGGGLNGDEQPVIYIDGVRVDNAEFEGFNVGGQGMSVLNTLNPGDIDKIEFLKGPAAAASYGTSGSNGVVLITTKRGKLQPGQSGGISFNYQIFGGSNRKSYDYSASDFSSANDANAIFRNGGILQQTLSATGGNPTLKYYASYDTRQEDGILRNDALDRKSARLNVDVFPNSKLTMRLSSNYTFSKNNRPNNDNNILGYLGNVLLRPRSYTFTDSIAIENILDETRGNRFIGSLSAEYTPFKNLFGRIIIGADDDSRRQDQTFPLNYRYGVSQNDQGTRRIFNRRRTHYTYTMDARYEYKLGSQLSSTAIVGAQMLNSRLETSFIDKFAFSTELITNVGAGSQLANTDEDFENRREAGIFTEHAFNYKDQYYLTLGIRRDYASVVGRDAPSINYPKASFAIRMDRYDFFPSFFNLMKLRVAYGETGILPALLDGIPLLWEAEPSGFGPGAVLSSIGNAEVKPERVKEIEMGFEAELFENYGVEFTYYRQRIRDSIIDFRNSPSTGLIASAVPFNIGEAKGSGVEVLLSANPIRSRNFDLGLTVIANYQTNEVIDLGGAQPIFDGFDINVIKEGLPKHEFYTPQVLGARLGSDGYYAGANLTPERVALGNPIPQQTGAFTLNIGFLKNFNLYALADWQRDLKLFNNTVVFARNFGNDPNFNRMANQLGLAGTNRAGNVGFFSAVDNSIPRLTPGSAEYQAVADQFALLDWRVDANFVEEADFLKLREISLSYSFKDFLPRSLTGNYLKDLVLGVSGQNLWTTTKYSGADPEVNFDGSRSLIRGQDFLTLMHPRTFNFFAKVAL